MLTSQWLPHQCLPGPEFLRLAQTFSIGYVLQQRKTMVSRVEERHSGLKQSLICILEEIYPEHDHSILNCFADTLAKIAIAKRSSSRRADLPQWSESDVLLIAYPDNIVGDATPPIQSLQKFLARHLLETISIVHVLPFFPSTRWASELHKLYKLSFKSACL